MNCSGNEGAAHCHSPSCSWLLLSNLKGLQNVPPLVPNPELSGIGVIFGFSVSAYCTLLLLILHYITVHSIQYTNTYGQGNANPVDHGILTFLRKRVISWSPSRRFEYAMERSVLILSDLNLVTGLGILITGYSRLSCGISAYHWQIMVFIAWFASFSFLSAMTFLEGYFQTNSSLRVLRAFSMCAFSSLLVAALLPTGSRMWLNLFTEDEDGFYPTLGAVCFYKQLGMRSFLHRGPKIWSMLFSVAVVAISYIHCAVRLFDPTAKASRNYLRKSTGLRLKQLLYYLERRSIFEGAKAYIYVVFHTTLYAAFTALRALVDILESMLLEIIWLAFAMAWGTIKIWETRLVAGYNYDGETVTFNREILVENTWSFGQTLPLVLLLLPLLSMAQTYLDNDAKAQETIPQARTAGNRVFKEVTSTISGRNEGTNPHTGNEVPPDRFARTRNINSDQVTDHTSHRNVSDITVTSPLHLPAEQKSMPRDLLVHLPRYPYEDFIRHPWYKDHILLLICQILMATTFALWVLTEWANVFGISAILRNKLFLIWILAIMPLASLVHLGLWYAAAIIVSRAPGVEEWLRGEGERMGSVRVGKVVYWALRLGLVGGCLTFTLVVSLELAGPDDLQYN